MWCDTNFAKGTAMDLDEVLTAVDVSWGDHPVGPGVLGMRMVVISGGEPTLQLDEDLVRGLQQNGWYVAIETNGTLNNPALGLCDHVCVSPKRGSVLEVWRGDELKVVLPGGVPGTLVDHQWPSAELHDIAARGRWGELFVQPQDVTDTAHVEQTYLHSISKAKPGEFHAGAVQFASNVKACMDFLAISPGWRLSYQVHKAINVK
jgi:organic radical activating enzyme